MKRDDWHTPISFKVGSEPKILVFRYVGDRGPSEIMLMPVELPDTAVTLEQVLAWLPYSCSYEPARYLIIDSKYQLNATTAPESPIVVEPWGRG